MVEANACVYLQKLVDLKVEGAKRLLESLGRVFLVNTHQTHLHHHSFSSSRNQIKPISLKPSFCFSTHEFFELLKKGRRFLLLSSDYDDFWLERLRIIIVLISGFWGLLSCIVKMFGYECFWWSNQPSEELNESDPQPFSLPAPLPQWPPGNGFASGRISLGEIEVIKLTKFESIWSCKTRRGKTKGIRFYRPIEIPDGFFSLGHYCQLNDKPLRGYVLAARDITLSNYSPPLRKPTDYTLIWSADTNQNSSAYFWFPNPPLGYKSMGFVVTNQQEEPSLDEVRCVRADLTETSEACHLILDSGSSVSKDPLQVWKTRPCKRGITCRGVSVGTFFCRSHSSSNEEFDVACLKNLDPTLHAMPTLDQIHALINNYGPTVYFHPDEAYLPSSVGWFFKNGALLYRDGKAEGEPIDYWGSKLPRGESNDGEFWIDLPSDDDARNYLKKGNIESAKLYVHVKPALGGAFTDIAMWVFCPFNGPATLKVGLVSIEMNKIGEHVSDWEHYTLRVCNFSGELWQMYFSEHSGGGWVDPVNFEFIKDNKPIVYSSKNGHASFPHAGTYLQGSSKLGIGARNDCAKSDLFLDSSTDYEIVSAEYLREGIVEEPCWLQYMREWGPTVVYDSRSEVDKLINGLPLFVRFSVENLFDLFPTELYGEEGPTGPKEKNNWEGDERW